MAETTHKQALPAGHRLDSYRVERVIGVGGFGVTYLAEHAALGRPVAVKEYLPNEFAVRDGTEVHPKSQADRDDFQWGLERFLDEARTMARFEHRNIVRVRDFFEANRTAYLVMDYEDGEPLDRILERRGRLTEAQLLRVLLPVVDGLREVHAAGFLHRDIKPSNVYVRRSDESPVLLDFGAARQALGRKSKNLTAVVSAGYSPPEQYEDESEQGPWSDIYALSALCRRAITGEALVAAPRRQGMLLRGQPDPLPRLAEDPPEGYSTTLLEAVDRGLSVIETERPQGLDEWSAGFRDHVAGRTPKRESADAPLAHGPELESEAEADPAVRRPADGAQHRGLAALAAATGVKAYELGDYARALHEFGIAAEHGNAMAQYYLGLMHTYGRGVAEDDAQAVAWYRRAAEQGHADAQASLGFMHRKGIGVPQDDAKAAVWFLEAAKRGHADAQNSLAVLYRGGTGVAQNDAEAFAWFRRAAEQGHADAQYSLGNMYREGSGVARDHARPVLWGRHHYDQAQAFAWYRRAAEQGHADAQYSLGNMYASAVYSGGSGIAQKDHARPILWGRRTYDEAQAAAWYRRAAEQGHADAQNRIRKVKARIQE